MHLQFASVMPILATMNAIQRAIKTLGSQAHLAQALGVRQPTISEWAKGERPIPIERCVQIEQATKGAVRRQDLRPDDWQRIWPELISPKRKKAEA